MKILWLLAAFIAVTLAEEDNPCLGNEGIRRFPDSTDCTRFYLCIGEESFPSQCGVDMIFDVITEQCNDESVSVCIKDIETPPTPSVPGDTTTATDDDTTGVPEAPTGSTTLAPEAPTPEPAPTTVTTPATTTIATAPTPEPTTTTTTPTTTIPTAPPATTTTPAPVTTTTPAPITTTTPAPTSAPTTTLPPGPEPHCPLDQTFYAPHPNCNMFFRCFFGTLFVLECPPNQYWNQDRKYCDHPFNVQCPSG
ncbi:mucin-2-like [Wyeomyia smithii]|uniref:mucin-2-like n=1 Tax=Wyeomyia smithii TaxID=174621 RepID=UPI002467F76A|nr:mucin-2-like [Wyeomyia smithii]